MGFLSLSLSTPHLPSTARLVKYFLLLLKSKMQTFCTCTYVVRYNRCPCHKEDFCKKQIWLISLRLQFVNQNYSFSLKMEFQIHFLVNKNSKQRKTHVCSTHKATCWIFEKKRDFKKSRTKWFSFLISTRIWTKLKMLWGNLCEQEHIFLELINRLSCLTHVNIHLSH